MWFYGQSQREDALDGWFANQVSKGWVADSQVDLQGFPNRYDAVFKNLNLANPNNGWAWKAAQFQLAQLSYKPSHFIAIWPRQQTVSTPNQTIDIRANSMRASLEFTDRTAAKLEQIIWETETLNAQSNRDWGIKASDGIFAIRALDMAKNQYQFSLNTQGLAPSTALLRIIDRAGALPDELETTLLDGKIITSAPLGLSSFETGGADINALSIDDLHVKWGDLVLRAKGDVTFDQQGYPTGEVTLRAVNWTRMLDMAVAAGTLEPNLSNNLKTGLRLLAALSGNPDILDVPVNFANRQTRIGPISIGEAPRLKLR